MVLTARVQKEQLPVMQSIFIVGITWLAGLAHAGDTISSSALSIRQSTADAYLCATTSLKVADKLYHFNVSLDGSEATLVANLSMPWDPKEGWKQTGCSSAQIQLIQASDPAEEDTLLIPVNAIDCSNQAGGCRSSIAVVQSSKGVLQRQPLPDDAGNPLAMTIDSQTGLLYVSTSHGKLLKYAISASSLKLVEAIYIPSPCAQGYYPLMTGLVMGVSTVYQSPMGVAMMSEESKKVLWGAVSCPPSTPFASAGAGSVVQFAVDGAMTVLREITLPGTPQAGTGQMGYSITKEGPQLYVPITVQCADEPATLCAAMYSVSLAHNNSLTQLGPLWNTSALFYGEPGMGVATVYQSPMSAAVGVLVSGVACSPQLIPPLETQTGATLQGILELPPSYCSPNSTARTAFFEYEQSEAGVSDTASSVSVYHFLSVDVPQLAGEKGMLVFGVQDGGFGDGGDQLLAMVVDRNTRKAEVVKSTPIPVVP